MRRSRLLLRPACSAGFGSFISFYFIFSPSSLVSFLISKISISASCFTEGGLYNLPGYLPTSAQSSHLVILLFHRFLQCLFPPLHLSSTQGFPFRCSERFALLISSPLVILSLSLLLPPSLSPPHFRLPGCVSLGASFAGFEPLCLLPSEDLGALFLPNSLIGSAPRQHKWSVFVSSLPPRVAIAAPTAQLSRSRATMAGSKIVFCVKYCRLNQTAVRCNSSLVSAFCPSQNMS